MFEFHADRKRYFDIQLLNAEKYVLPFIEANFIIIPNMRVLEIGCGEGGVLKAFINKGCMGVGVEFDEIRIINGEKWLADDIKNGRISFVAKNIYDTNIESLGGKFDIIILKDVIEHIHDQERLLTFLKDFLTPSGIIFFGFPPWQMPFGGHQQLCQKRLSKVPYFHLLPRSIYKRILKVFGESDPVIILLLEIKETGISIERFEKIVKKTNYHIVSKIHYLFNPIYEYKFNLKPKKQNRVISKIPYVRDYITTCVYYIIKGNGVE
ncbi:MAG TPA: class I SAM-dependent methyltransferase [Hanamia sp.]|nr:class I SAM-dependent methyltransferase [Hanamia sp.]